MRQLGAGRTGRVFLATYQSTGAYVAIKYLNATLRRDAEFMDRFRSDTPHLVELDHPDVVRLYEYVETPTRAAVVMELVDGVSLRTLLAEHGHVTPEAALAVLKSTLLALAAAHERGVPHRDVTPDNILVQADGSTKLGDFGVVVHAEEPGVPAGTPWYMSPELWTRGAAGPPADLYAAACVLFEAVRGRPPYVAERRGAGGTPFMAGTDGGPHMTGGPYLAGKAGGDRAPDVPALRRKHVEEPLPLEVAPDALRDLLRRGLAKDPAGRYASARQFAAELEEDAVAGYGPDWEKRGRRHLAEQATLLALRFPLARTDSRTSVAAGLRDRVPRLPPQLWVAGATVVAALIAILLSGGHLPAGPGTILMPPPQARTETRTEAQTEPRSSEPAPTTRTSGPAARPTTAPPGTATPPPPTPQGGTSVSLPAVRAAGIVAWNGATGSISVSVDGTGPVRLLIAYTRRDADGGAATTVRRETRTLRGRTSYTSAVSYAPGEPGCGERVHLGLLVMTEPAAANGPQVSEAAVSGPACPAPSPTRSATPAPQPTPSPSLTDSPIAPPPASETPAARPSDAPVSRLSDAPAALPPDPPGSQLSGAPAAQPSDAPVAWPPPDASSDGPIQGMPRFSEEPSRAPLLPAAPEPSAPE
ncbi:serine/threonine-protein kinase [Nonomuraea thailandensis]|uniref:non-specific serine/threonine protein kinase n=1 Tax=Nonomuraea thailandensis TaxID=1188745 RepID=A0A9X2GNG4_9ACTN|nr:serine/threonine-protein kinase [Nonomuraea thailandensis]MCP2361035.1 serine/threonine-protein kinase [Nonomuraea thailandensis]